MPSKLANASVQLFRALGGKQILPTASFQRQAWFSTDLAKMSKFYSLKAKKLDGTEVDFASLKGKVVLIENTASL